MIKMKDSGVDWIGDIPIDWNLVQTKRYFHNKKQIVGSAVDEYERLALTLNGVVKRSKDDNEGLQPEKFESYQILCQNEIVFKLIDLENVKTSRVGLSPFTGLVSPAYIVMSNNSEDNRFYYYWFMFMYYNEVFNHLGGAGVRSALNAKDVMMLPIPDIDLSLQKRIADYLDEKCRKIDEIIEKQQTVIEKLKEYKLSVITEAVTLGLNKNVDLKDSRIAWIGNINNSYSLSRVGAFSFVTKLAGFEYTDTMVNGISPDETIPIVRAQNVRMFKFNDNNISEYIGEDISKSLQRCALDKKAVLITFIGAGIGDVCIFDKENRHHLAPNVAKIEIRDEFKNILLEEFLMYYLGSYAGKGEIQKISKASAQPSLSMGTIRGIKIVLPTIKEQYEIVNYLNEKCQNIDKLILSKEEVIKRLSEYKKSLIYEVVTGKKEV